MPNSGRRRHSIIKQRAKKPSGKPAIRLVRRASKKNNKREKFPLDNGEKIR